MELAKLSHYGQYIKERTDKGIVETADGFATFEYVADDVVYIVDLYVVPERRKQRVAATIADKICEAAVKDGKKYLLGSVDVTAKGAETSINVLEAYGMKPYKVAEPMIFYIKPIGEQAEDKKEV